jgi:hypothetical protein
VPWGRIDDGFDDDPDLDKMSCEAISLFWCAISWCSRNLTDGFVPEGRVTKLPGGTREAVEQLTSGDKPWWLEVQGGYQIRSYLKFNPSREQVLSEREANKKRVNDFRERKRIERNTVTQSITNTVNNGGCNSPKTDCEVPTSKSENQIEIGKTKERNDDRFKSSGDVGCNTITNTINPGHVMDHPVSRIPNTLPNGSDEKPSPVNSNGKADRKPNQAWEEVSQVLSGICDGLGWDPPLDKDIRRHLKPDSALRQLANLFGPPGAVELFLFAHRTWKGKVSWEAVFDKRNILREEMGNGGEVISDADRYRKDPTAEFDFDLRVETIDGEPMMVRYKKGTREPFNEEEWHRNRLVNKMV